MATHNCSAGVRRRIPVQLTADPLDSGSLLNRALPSDRALRRVDAPASRFLVIGAGRRPAAEAGVVFSPDTDATFDALILVDAAAVARAPAVLRRHHAWLAPVVDLSGTQAWFADVRCDDASPASWRRAVEQSLHVLDALAALPAVVTDADDVETLLLARVHSRAAHLQPAYDPTTPRLVRYPAAGLLEEPERAAERLADQGWLARTFFDRMHVCPNCASSRLNVREECPACRSAEIGEETLVHHFRCAHQAIERAFVHADALVCPKCRRRLRHFGVDYDRPGSVTVCQACGHIDTDAAVAFVCIDCGRKSDATVVATRDWHAYRMTAAGEQRLLGGDLRSLRPKASEAATFHALAGHWLRIQERYGRPSTVLRLAFTRTSEVNAEVGPRTLAMARRQAIEIVRGELRDTDFMVEAPEGLLIVMPETDARAVEVPRRRILDRLSAMLSIDLGIDIRRIDPGELLAPAEVSG